MNNKKEKIENFVDEAIKNNDYRLLDILWTFSYSVSPMSGYHYKDKEPFKKWFGKVCTRNLQKKYGLELIEVKGQMKVFIDFLNNMPDFLSRKTFDEDDRLLREILIYKSSNILVKNIKNKLQDLSDLDKKIVSFVLNYIPIRIQDSINEAEKIKQDYPKSEDIYGYLSDFQIHTNKETGEIVYYEIDPKEWTYIFNLLFDEELKDQRFKTKSYRRKAGFIILPSEQHEEHSFWQFGDELVNIGIAYWKFWLRANGKVGVELIIPSFIYDHVKSFKDKLLKPENFENEINEIKKEKETKKVEKEWRLEEFGETKPNNEVLEVEIESKIVSDPIILEEGLELIGNQYQTSVGYIDILCRDKNENFVVIELKRGIGSYKVIGQIQKYMAWISENLAKDKQVRGIIVVKEYDRDLGYAMKGSKFPIEIKIFGQEPPTEENIRYCDRCGKANKKSAKYCIKCGQEFWL